ncbi:hypothetical protein P8625_11825 [Tenacibaculum tangerinum]|uniref:DUF4268 domain-containing protein n=1 Tax=Tenacibaculum tangerinum TaxID=3038772 RepID=A0ABY8L0F7_9FLAO|nr:hypothetical protein [Tenacibaculum tangerinum]WGH74766.1 hypothetical protein P8625_11825 [Tenacibaculum tangerinum]
MKYTYTTNPYKQKGVNNFYGVEYDSIPEGEKSLIEIGWGGWTVKEVQNLIDKTKSLEGEDYFDYIVEGSELRICIDNEYVLFFDWRTETIDEDFRWTTIKFLDFMESFKLFLEENGR